MSVMAQQRIMAEEADAAAEATALREAMADTAMTKLEKAEPAVPGPVVPKVIRDEPKKPDTGTCDNCNAPLMKADGMPTARAWKVIGTRLREEMPTKERPGRGGKFKYITARQVQDRLDAVAGPGNWETRFLTIDLNGPAVECTLTVFGVSKADIGYSNAPDAEHESEALKAAYSDAFKRAAVQFGIGRFLYGDLV